MRVSLVAATNRYETEHIHCRQRITVDGDGSVVALER